jgi:hypothetical protein
MEGNRCHENVACLWDQRKKRGKLKGIATGDALNEDGMWRWHSWCLTATHILETTDRHARYFGIPMNAEDAVYNGFVALTDLLLLFAGVKATHLLSFISSERAHMAAALWHATETSNHRPHELRPLTNSP